MNILFLCTGNSARSVIAEGILRHLGAPSISAFSAGSQPTGKPNPGAIAILQEKGIDTSFARSKSWDEFSGQRAPSMDIVITVCANAAGESCPIWPAHPVSAHWGVEDPALVTAPDEAVRAAFAKTYDEMFARISAFLSLSHEVKDEAWLADIRAIGDLS